MTSNYAESYLPRAYNVVEFQDFWASLSLGMLCIGIHEIICWTSQHMTQEALLKCWVFEWKLRLIEISFEEKLLPRWFIKQFSTCDIFEFMHEHYFKTNWFLHSFVDENDKISLKIEKKNCFIPHLLVLLMINSLLPPIFHRLAKFRTHYLRTPNYLVTHRAYIALLTMKPTDAWQNLHLNMST